MRWRETLVLGAAGATLISSLAAAAGITTTDTESTDPPGVPAAQQVHFTAVGDFDRTTATGQVLDGIAAADPDLHLALGDLSYGKPGGESAWCDFVKSRTGEGFPFQLISGNHESNGLNGNINDFSACLPNQLPGLVGTYGRQWYVDVPQQDPLVRFVMISPALTYSDGTWSYDAGTPRHRWTADTIDDARAKGIPWVVAGLHKPCLSVGKYSCDIGADLVNMLMAKQVDLVLHGHEHHYQRSKQLDLRQDCTGLTIDGYDADCVADQDNEFVKGEGTVFATIGNGGRLQRPADPSDPEAAYFQTTAGSPDAPVYGFGDVTLTEDRMTARFQGVGGTAFSDAFTVTRDPEAAPNTPPVAAYTTSGTAETITFDGSTSTDADGVVTTYLWDFGDGSGAGGVSPTHRYDAAGTYDVTLTVTDDRGATSSVTTPVTVAATPAALLAGDTFTRTLANGWGSAELGGPYSLSPTTSGVWSVGSGAGRVIVASARGTVSAYLRNVSTDDLDARYTLSVDKVPTGSGSRVDQTVFLRRIGAESYRAVVRLAAGGRVQLLLKRVGVASSNLTPVTTVSGLTYAPGDELQVRAQATGTSPTTLRVKVWKVGTPEPAGWTLTAQDASASLQGPGYAGLQAYLTSTVTNAPIQVTYDDLQWSKASILP